MILHVDLLQNGYDIVIERGAIAKASTYLRLNRRVLVVTDSGVPAAYAEAVCAQCASPFLVTIPQGEKSKCFPMLEKLCRALFLTVKQLL